MAYGQSSPKKSSKSGTKSIPQNKNTPSQRRAPSKPMGGYKSPHSGKMC